MSKHECCVNGKTQDETIEFHS